MKKIMTIFFLALLLTGCFSYQELNNMAIITSIGIDKTEKKYTVILKETIPRKEENKTSTDYKYYKGTGSTIEKAIEKAKENSSKDIYLKQVQNMMLTDKKIAKQIPASFKNSIVLFQVKNLEKVLTTNSNYKYLNNLAKDKTVTLKDYRKNPKKKIPHIKVYKKELLIKGLYYK